MGTTVTYEQDGKHTCYDRYNYIITLSKTAVYRSHFKQKKLNNTNLRLVFT